MLDSIKSQEPKTTKHRRWPKVLGGVVLLLILIVGGLVLFPPQALIKTLAGTKGSSGIGRQFAIDGNVDIHWGWTTPYVHLTKLRLENMAGEKDPNMITIDAVDFHIKIWKLLLGQLNIPDITIDKPVIILAKNANGEKNWDFPAVSKANTVSHAALPNSRSSFPILGTLTIHNGTLIYRDDTKGLSLNLGIDSASANGGNGDQGFKLSGTGLLQGKSFNIDTTGGSLNMLRDSSADYPLDLRIEMGQTVVSVKGTFHDPVKVTGVNAVLDMHGDNLADLFYLTQIPLPPTAPYKLTGHLTRKGELWAFEDFKGQVGQSDLSGRLSYDTTNQHGKVEAQLVSDQLRMDDLAGFIGVKPGSDKEKTDARAGENKRLLPDVPLNLTRLRATDMNVTFKATRIDQPGWPIDNMDTHIVLTDGVLRIDPLSFGVANGKVSGSLVLDGRDDIPKMQTDLTLQRLSLKPFFKDSQFAAFSTGHFGGRFQIKGQGKSLAEVLADSNGRMMVMMSGGTVSKLIIEAAGLDFGKVAPLLLGKDESTDIRCAVGDFGVTDGYLKSDALVFDTSASNIDGNANINLKDETIDAKIEAHPKEVSLTARTPITITGKLRKPSVGLDPTEIAERGVAAAALSVLTPIAGIIPFIELGLGEDSDCKALIDQAHAHEATEPSPAKPPSEARQNP